MRVVIAAMLLMASAAAAQPVRTQVVIVMPEDGPGGIPAAGIGETIAAMVEDESPVSPGQSPIVPRGGVTAIGVVTYAPDGPPVLALPPTAVRHGTIGTVGAALRRPTGERRGTHTGLPQALTLAAESIAASGLGGYRHVLVLVDDRALGCGSELRAARDAALERVDQVNAIALVRVESALSRWWLMEHVCDSRRRLPGEGHECSLALAAVVHVPKVPRDSRSDRPPLPEGTVDRIAAFQHYNGSGGATADRDYWLDNLVESKVDVTVPPPFANEDHIAFAGLHTDSPGSPLFEINPGPFGWPQVQQRILMRLTVCPGDYDRDGDVDVDDAVAFQIDFQNQVLYANWNFDDNIWNPQPDVEKFNAEHANACATP